MVNCTSLTKKNRLISNPNFSGVFASEHSMVSEFVLPIKVSVIFEFNDVFYDTEEEALEAEEKLYTRCKGHDEDDFDFWYDFPSIHEYVVRHIE